MQSIFTDRREAGKELGLALHDYARQEDVLVLALSGEGVPIGFEVARALHAELDVLVVCPLCVENTHRHVVGAVVLGGDVVLEAEHVKHLALSPGAVEQAILHTRKELLFWERQYRGELHPVNPRQRTVIVVEEGLSTGAPLKAAIQALRKEDVARIVVAIPTAPARILDELQDLADEVHVLLVPKPFHSVAHYYQYLTPVESDSVQELLLRARGFKAGRV